MRRLALAFAVTLSLSFPAQAADQVRSAAPFTAISVQGPISVTVEAGKAQSVTVRGGDKFANAVISEVVNGELRLRMRDRHFSTDKDDQRVLITVPQLRAFSGEGAGETLLNNIRGERFEVSYRGAGRVVVSGAVHAFKMRAEGVGEVDSKALIANEADIRFQGIGDVRVYAKDKLDVAVQGMGSLTYYGKPRTMHKTVAGIGTVSAGD